MYVLTVFWKCLQIEKNISHNTGKSLTNQCKICLCTNVCTNVCFVFKILSVFLSPNSESIFQCMLGKGWDFIRPRKSTKVRVAPSTLRIELQVFPGPVPPYSHLLPSPLCKSFPAREIPWEWYLSPRNIPRLKNNNKANRLCDPPCLPPGWLPSAPNGKSRAEWDFIVCLHSIAGSSLPKRLKMTALWWPLTFFIYKPIILSVFIFHSTIIIIECLRRTFTCGSRFEFSAHERVQTYQQSTQKLWVSKHDTMTKKKKHELSVLLKKGGVDLTDVFNFSIL